MLKDIRSNVYVLNGYIEFIAFFYQETLTGGHLIL